MDIEAYELHERIERVEEAEATENDLVTVAVPPEKSLGEALEQVEEDRAEAEYIDTEGENEAYLEALERVRRVLQRQETTPEQGMVVYAGVVDGEVVSYVFDDLPSRVSEFVYERDNEFDTSVLEGVEQSSKTFGLLVVERGGAALGLTHNDDVQVVETLDSDVMGKTKAGGQSAQRFERERERQKEEFFEEVAEEAERAFLGEHDDESASGRSDGVTDSAETDIDGLLLGGTNVTVDDFREGDHLDYRLEDRLVGGPVSVEYGSEQGLHQLVEKASDRIEDEERREMRDLLDRFFDALHEGGAGGASDASDAGDSDQSDGDSVVYGPDEVERALEYDAVEAALLSADLPVDEVQEIQDQVAKEGGDCVVVPTDFDRGRQFNEAFGGVAAILRFPIE